MNTAPQRRIFLTLLAIGTFANMDKGMIGLTVNKLQDASYMRGLGLEQWTAGQAGMILSIFYVSFILVTLPGGYVVDRFGYRKFVLFSLIVLPLGSIVFGMVGVYAGAAIFLLLPAARLLTGFGHAGYTNGSPPIIARNFSPEDRGDVQGKVVATAGIGAILAYTLGAWVLNVDWRDAYLLIAGLFTIAFLMFLFLVPEHHDTPQEAAIRAHAPKVRFSEAWTDRNTLVLALALLFNNLVGVGLLSWLPSMFGRHFGVRGIPLTLILIGYALTMLIATATAAPLVNKYFPDKETRFIALFSLLGSAFLVLAVCVHKGWGAWAVWLSAALFWLANLCIMWAFGAILLLPYRLIPVRIIGSAFAVINIGAFVGGIIQGVMVGAIVDKFYYPWAMTTLAVLLLIGGFVPFLYKDQPAVDTNSPGVGVTT